MPRGDFPGIPKQNNNKRDSIYHVGNSYALFFLFAYLRKSVIGPFQDDIKV